MKNFYESLLFLYFIGVINCLPENLITDGNNNGTDETSYSDGLLPPLNAFYSNSGSNRNNGLNVEDSEVFTPMEDFDEEAIDAYCVDISNDCEEREHFCQNPAFHKTMLERCPRTCNLCKELISRRTIPTTTTEVDEDEDYSMPEIPDTPKPLPPSTLPPTQRPTTPSSSHESTPTISLNQLVGSAENHIIDIEAAVNKASATKRTKKLRARRVCRDLASDCSTKLRLCTSTFYSTIMERFCQKSCNFCAEKQTFKKHKLTNRPNSRPAPRNRSKVRQTSATCVDVGIDCNEKRSLCTHRSYTTLMQRMCPSTCNMCNTV